MPPVNPRENVAGPPRIDAFGGRGRVDTQIQFAFLWRNLRWLRLFFYGDGPVGENQDCQPKPRKFTPSKSTSETSPPMFAQNYMDLKTCLTKANRANFYLKLKVRNGPDRGPGIQF